MWQVILLSGLVISGGSVYLMLRGELLAGLIDQVFGSRWLYLAAVLRLLLGAALIASAPAVNFPQAITAIGWLLALSGLVLVAVPRELLLGVAHWLAGLPAGPRQAYLMIGLGLGGFMVYAALG